MSVGGGPSWFSSPLLKNRRSDVALASFVDGVWVGLFPDAPEVRTKPPEPFRVAEFFALDFLDDGDEHGFVPFVEEVQADELLRDRINAIRRWPAALRAATCAGEGEAAFCLDLGLTAWGLGLAFIHGSYVRVGRDMANPCFNPSLVDGSQF